VFCSAVGHGFTFEERVNLHTFDKKIIGRMRDDVVGIIVSG
jgi:hypothetical protein